MAFCTSSEYFAAMDVIEVLKARILEKLENLSGSRSTAPPKKKFSSSGCYHPNMKSSNFIKYPTNDNYHQIMNYPTKGHVYSVMYLTSDGKSYSVMNVAPISPTLHYMTDLVATKIYRERFQFKLETIYKTSEQNPHMRNVVEYVIDNALKRGLLVNDPRCRAPTEQSEWNPEELHKKVKLKQKEKYGNKRATSLLLKCQLKNTIAYLKFGKKSLKTEWKKRDTPGETLYCFSGNIEMSGKDILRMCLRDRSLIDCCHGDIANGLIYLAD